MGHFVDENISFAITCNGLNCDLNQIGIAMTCAAFNLPLSAPEREMVKLLNTDCNTAIEINDSIAGPFNVSVDYGQYKEFGEESGCESCRESSSAWFKFNTDHDTILTFDLVSLDGTDYDFALYKCPGENCINQNGESNLVKIRYCFSSTSNAGITGLSNSAKAEKIGVGPAYVSSVPVKAGDTYYLMVNYSLYTYHRTPLGFKIYFYDNYRIEKARLLRLYEKSKYADVIIDSYNSSTKTRDKFYGVTPFKMGD